MKAGRAEGTNKRLGKYAGGGGGGGGAIYRSLRPTHHIAVQGQARARQGTTWGQEPAWGRVASSGGPEGHGTRTGHGHGPNADPDI